VAFARIWRSLNLGRGSAATSEEYMARRERTRLYRDLARVRANEAARLLSRVFIADAALRLLDLGSSDGLMLAELQRRFPVAKIVGLDESPEAVQAAAERGVEVVLGDAAAIPLPAASFEAVTIMSTLKHVPDARRVLSECRRVLVPGGHLILADATPFGIRIGFRMKHFVPGTVFHRWSVREAAAELERAGFLVIESRRYMPAPIDFAGREAVERALGELGLDVCFMQQVLFASAPPAPSPDLRDVPR
jgi:ubiquinone/menaquinone biosynthesis C-methylase UbiE